MHITRRDTNVTKVHVKKYLNYSSEVTLLRLRMVLFRQYRVTNCLNHKVLTSNR
jgi:hypothetical protein